MKRRLIFLLAILFFCIGVVLFLLRDDIQKRFFSEVVSLKNEVTFAPSIQEKNFLQIDFLDIGQGDASLITFPSGEQMLVDCSLDARILEALGRVMDFRDHTIEYLAITHPHQDHDGGCVDVLKRYEVKQVIYTGFKKNTDSYLGVFFETVQNEPAVYSEISSEQTWTIGSTTVHFLYPDSTVSGSEIVPDRPSGSNANNTSLVFSLQYGKEKVLFMGDAETEEETYLLKKYGGLLDVDVLKAGHHGSQTSSGNNFLKVVTPSVVTISSGKGNSYGHPSLRTLKRFERSGTQIWRTDEKGDIILQIYPDHIYVQNP